MGTRPGASLQALAVEGEWAMFRWVLQTLDAKALRSVAAWGNVGMEKPLRRVSGREAVRTLAWRRGWD